jgi:hypothetical protein
LVEIASRVPQWAANCFSNSTALGPLVTQPLRRHSATARSSSGPKTGLDMGMAGGFTFAGAVP